MKQETHGIERLLIEDQSLVTFLVGISGGKLGRILWAQNCDHVLGYTLEDNLDLNTLIPTCFRTRHSMMMNNLIFKRSTPKIFRDEYNMHIVSKSRKLLYGKWRIYLTNLKDTRELAILATFRKSNAETDFGVLSADYGLEECTETFYEFLQTTTFLQEADLRCDGMLWEGVFKRKKAMVCRSGWDLMNSCPPILILTVSVEDAALLVNSMDFFRLSDHDARQGVRFENESTAKDSERPELGFLTDATTESSFSPNRLFDNKIEAMHNYEKRLSWLLLLGSVAMGGLGIIVSLVILTTIQLENSSFNESIGQMNQLGLRRYLAVTAALRSKELYLLSLGFTEFGNETQARLDLQIVSATMKSLQQQLVDQTLSVSDEYQQMMSNQVQLYWKFIEDHYQMHFLSVYDVMSEIAASAGKLASVPLAEITENLDHFRNLYRNGPGNSLTLFNETIVTYITSEENARLDRLARLETIVITAVFGLMTVGLAVLVPVFAKLEMWRRSIWKVLFSIPKKPVRLTFENIALHLREHHQCDEGSVPDIQVSSQPPPAYCMTRFKRFLLVGILIHVLATAGVQYLVYSEGVQSASEILHHKPLVMNWGGLRRADGQLARFYMREAWLNVAYPHQFVSNEEDNFNPMQKWVQTVEDLMFIQRALTYGGDSTGYGTELQLSDAHRELFFGCKACRDSPGIDPLIADLEVSSVFFQADMLETDYRSFGGTYLEGLISRIQPLLSASVTQYDTDSAVSLSKMEESALFLTVVYVVMSAAYFSCVLAPLILKVGNRQSSKEMRREIALFLYLPKDSILKFIIKL